MRYWLADAISIIMNRIIKKLTIKTLALFIGLTGVFKTAGQNKTIDSLKSVIGVQKEDTNKVRNLYTLYLELDPTANNSKLQIQYGKEILALSKKLNFKPGQGKAYYLLTNSYGHYQDYINYNNYMDSAINIFTEIKNDFFLGSLFIWKGFLYTSLGDTASAIDYYNQGLRIFQEIKDGLGISQALNGIGELYRDQGKYDEALQKHFAALKICKAPGFDDKGWGLPYSYQSIGTVYAERGDALVQKKEKQTPVADYTIAMAYYDTAIQLFSRIDDKGGLAELSYQTGNIYLKSGDFLTAQKRFQQSLNFYSQTDYNFLKEELYLAMSKLDSINGDYLSAYNHYKLYVAQKERLNIEETSRKVEVSKLKSELEKKVYQIKLLAAESKLNKQKKRFAYTGISVIFFMIGLSVYWFLRKRKLQNHQTILSERLRISKDLHDEIGATLSGIAMYSHIIKANLENKQLDAANQSIDIIQHSATEMVTKLNDIIWLINPQKESLEEVITKLKEYALNMCAAKNITPRIEVTGQIAACKPAIEARRNIYLFCKEAVNNAVKYSNSNLLIMNFLLHQSKLEISIKDNGTGFDINNIKKGNGLDNMQKRADDMGAVFSIQSKPQEGCSISLKLKITQQGIV